MYLREYIHIHKYSRTTNHKEAINFERDRRISGSVFEGWKGREKSWDYHIFSKKAKRNNCKIAFEEWVFWLYNLYNEFYINIL